MLAETNEESVITGAIPAAVGLETRANSGTNGNDLIEGPEFLHTVGDVGAADDKELSAPAQPDARFPEGSRISLPRDSDPVTAISSDDLRLSDFLSQSDHNETEDEGESLVTSSRFATRRFREDKAVPVVSRPEDANPLWNRLWRDFEEMFRSGRLLDPTCLQASSGHRPQLIATLCSKIGALFHLRLAIAAWAFTTPALFGCVNYRTENRMMGFPVPPVFLPPPVLNSRCIRLITALIFGLSFEKQLEGNAHDDDDFLQTPIPRWYEKASWNLPPQHSDSLENSLLCLTGCFGYLDCRNAADLCRSHIVPTPIHGRSSDDSRNTVMNCRVVPVSGRLVAVSRWIKNTLDLLRNDPSALSPSSEIFADAVLVLNPFTRQALAVLSNPTCPFSGSCWALTSFSEPAAQDRPFVAVGDSGFNLTVWRDFFGEKEDQLMHFQVEQRSYSFAYVPEFQVDKLYVGCGNPIPSKETTSQLYEGQIVVLNLTRQTVLDGFYDAQAVGESRSHFGAVWGLDADPNLSMLFSVSDGSFVRLWDPRTHKRFALAPLRGLGFSLYYAEDKHLLLVGVADPRGFGVIEMKDPRMLGSNCGAIGTDFVPCRIEDLPPEARQGKSRTYACGPYGLRDLLDHGAPWPEPQNFWNRASYKFSPFKGVSRLERLWPELYLSCRRFSTEYGTHFPFLRYQSHVWDITRVNETHFAAVCGDTVALWKINKSGIQHAKFRDVHAYQNRFHGVCAISRELEY